MIKRILNKYYLDSKKINDAPKNKIVLKYYQLMRYFANNISNEYNLIKGYSIVNGLSINQ